MSGAPEGRITHLGAVGCYKGIPFGASPDVHKQCIALVKKHVPVGQSVLDSGGGYGAFSLRLHEEGYNVEAVELDPSEWKVEQIPVRQADLNEPLVDWGVRYDCVVAIEVIEHLHNPYKFFRDCRTLLRPGGVLVYSTPNVVDLDSRRIFATTGHFFMFRKDSVRTCGHTTVLPYWLLEEIMDVEDLQVLDRVFCGRKRRPWPKSWLTPLVNLLFLPFGLGVPLSAAFPSSVAYAVTPKAPAGSA